MIRLLENRVLVEQDEAKNETESGVIIAAEVEKPTKGTVIAVGPGSHNQKGDFVPMSVSEGDRVVFGKGNGEEVEIEGKQYTMLVEPEVYGILS